MKQQQEKNLNISAILAFMLIPLGGFATDIYLPSFPSMAADLGVGVKQIQLSLLLFMVSLGFSQFFAGAVLDSFGRYRISMGSLIVFSAASVVIAISRQIEVIYTMRVLQGLTVSLIIVGKRAFFVDSYSGEKLKHYTSLFSIVWAIAPVVAPFVGGYLHNQWGWQANFYLLSLATTIIFFLELGYSGESLREFRIFQWKPIIKTYGKMLMTADFILGVVIVGLSYALLVIFGMTSPFVIEHVYGFSPVISGYSSLLSGTAMMGGGIISKLLMNHPLRQKLYIAVTLQLFLAMTMLAAVRLHDNLLVMLLFTFSLHIGSGFIFNIIYAYCLQRFTQNAGIASGITGGGVYLISSLTNYVLTHLIQIDGAEPLVYANLVIITGLALVIPVFLKASFNLSERQIRISSP